MGWQMGTHVYVVVCVVRRVCAVCAPCVRRVTPCRVVGVTCRLEDNDARNVVGVPQAEFQQQVTAFCEVGHVDPADDLRYATTCTSTAEFSPKRHCTARDYSGQFQKLFDADHDAMVVDAEVSELSRHADLALADCLGRALLEEADLVGYTSTACHLLTMGPPANLYRAVTKSAVDTQYDLYARDDVNVAYLKPVMSNAIPLPELVDGNFAGGVCHAIAIDQYVMLDLGYWYKVVRVVFTVNLLFNGRVQVYTVSSPEFDLTTENQADGGISECGTLEDPNPHPEMTFTVACSSPLQARGVGLQVNGANMSICELAVYTEQPTLNVAMGKTFVTTPPNLSSGILVRATDGTRLSYPNLRSCVHVSPGSGQKPSVVVDLGAVLPVYKVVIVTGSTLPQQTGFVVSMSSVSGGDQTACTLEAREVAAGQAAVVYCNTPVRARFVHLLAQQVDIPLGLCELEIYKHNTDSSASPAFVTYGHDALRASCPKRNTYPKLTNVPVLTEEACYKLCHQAQICTGVVYGPDISPQCIILTGTGNCENWVRTTNKEYISWKIGRCTAVTYANADQVVDGYYGEDRQAACSTGYSRDPLDHTANDFKMTCSLSGWIREPSTPCTAVKCTLSTAPASSTMSAGLPVTMEYTEQVTVTCIAAHVFRPDPPDYNAIYPNNYILTCGANNAFAAAPGSQCHRIPCSTPAPSNTDQAAAVTGVYEDEVMVTCTTGHHLTGQDITVTSFSMTCGADGQWGNVTDCEPVRCVASWPVNAVDSSASPSEQVNLTGTYNNMETITCIHGHVIVDTVSDTSYTTTCTASGNWNTHKNCTRIRCRVVWPVNTLLNGTAPPTAAASEETTSYLEGRFEDTASVQCITGHVVTGTAQDRNYTAMCQGDGNFNFSQGCTRIPCSTPAPANTNQATAVTGVYEDEVTVTCTTGHCVTGQDNTVTSFSMTCGADGQWGNVTDCEPVRCVASWPVNTMDSSTSPDEQVYLTGRYNNMETITCIYGYVVVDTDSDTSYTTTCRASGNWNTHKNCTRIACQVEWPVNTLLNGIAPSGASPFEGRFEDTTSVQCITGHIVTGTVQDRSYIAMCQGDGNFNFSQGCTRVPCSTPAPANTDQATAVTGVYEDEVMVTCTTGHRVTGQDNTVTNFSMTCGAEGQWGNVTDCEPVVCPEETLTGTEPLTGVYPNLVTVLCHPGYITTMEGPDVITDDNYMTDVVIDTYNTTCQEDGTWSFVIACRRTFCKSNPFNNSAFTLPPAAPVTGVYEDTRQVACLSGFWTNPGHGFTANCTAGGTWQVASCIPVECPLLTIAHSDVTGLTGTFDQAQRVTCDDNYETLYGATDFFSVCEDTGNWSRWDACLLRECEGLTLASTNITNQSLAAGKSAIGQCEPGYETENNGATTFTYTCGHSREWHGALTCSKVQCPPLLVAHSDTFFWNMRGEYGDEHNFRCRPGHHNAAGESVMRIGCGASGQWTPPPACDPVTCVTPAPAGTTLYPGTMRGSYPALQFVTCQQGYAVSGTTANLSYTAFCLHDATWSHAHTCSQVYCEALDPAPYGWQQGVLRGPYQTEAHVTCRPGYEANGLSAFSLVCGGLGAWNDTTAYCYAVRCPGLVAYNVDQAGVTGTFGQTVTARCLDGHRTPDGETAFDTTCGPDKRWTLQTSCWRLNCSALTLPNTTAVDVHGIAGENLTVSCISGHTITTTSHSFTLWCTAAGQWEYPASTCGLVECQPFIVRNSAQPSDSRVAGFYGDAVGVVCNQGHTLIDGSVSVVTACSANGTWNWTDQCLSIHCPLPVYPSSLVPVGPANTSLGAVVRFECAPGYMGPTGPGTDGTRCLPNATWTDLPLCTPVCPELSRVESGGYNVTVIGVRRVAQYWCDAGYKLRESYTTITCAHIPGVGTTWSAPPPTCQHISVDGEWTDWTDWTTCDHACDGGSRNRNRRCDSPRYGGRPCQGPYTAEETCNPVPCPVDSEIGPWSEWSACSYTCGVFRVKTRSRNCTQARHNGRTCADKGFNYRASQLQSISCPALAACPEPVYTPQLQAEASKQELEEDVSNRNLSLFIFIFCFTFTCGFVICLDCLKFVQWYVERSARAAQAGQAFHSY